MRDPSDPGFADVVAISSVVCGAVLLVAWLVV